MAEAGTTLQRVSTFLGPTALVRGSCIALLTAMPCAAQAGSWASTAQSIGGMDTWIYTPDSMSPVGQGRAAMIIMHGCAQTGTDMKTGGNLEVVAEQYGIVMAVPTAPDGGVGIYGCWDYYGSNHTRANRHNDNLIALGDHLRGRSDVDPDQVYIAGLSSGATQAQVTACLAPDIFAGIGSTGGPTMGTSESQAFVFGGSAATAASLCSGWAGSHAGLLATQVWNIAHGSTDSLVPYQYAAQNMQAIGIFKSISQNTGSSELPGAVEQTWGPSGEASFLSYSGMDHRWAAGGSSGGGTYIDHSSNRINYAAYLAQYFIAHNQRYNRNEGPLVSDLGLSANADSISASATITDAEGAVASATADVYDALASSLTTSFPLAAAGGGIYAGSSSALADGLYRVDVWAVDDDGAQGNTASDTVRVGPPPPPTPPSLSGTDVNIDGQCATVSGNVVDINDDLQSVSVAFNGSVAATTLDGGGYTATGCELPGGSNSAVVTASDDAGLSATDSIAFVIDAGVTATLSEHIGAGRLDYTAYSNCYLEYGAGAFRLDEIAAGGLCRWQDDDATCAGPLQACRGTDGDGNGAALDLVSQATQDGYVKAHADGSGATVGSYSTLALGRGSDGKFNRAILSFDTGPIPDDATISRAYVTLSHSSGSGSPWSNPSDNRLVVDIIGGCFAECGTQTGDWAAAADAADIGQVPAFSSGTQRSSDFSASGLAAINRTGTTQLRLRFALDPTSMSYLFVQSGGGAQLHVEY